MLHLSQCHIILHHMIKLDHIRLYAVLEKQISEIDPGNKFHGTCSIPEVSENSFLASGFWPLVSGETWSFSETRELCSET